MKPAIHIKQISYDVEKLKRDLSIIQDDSWHLHLAKQDHDGGWSAVSLVSRGGKMDAESIILGRDEPYSKTPLCAKTPYFNEIIDGFQCEKLRVRLMRLAPGKVIKEHKDPRHSWVSGQVRLHIPIITNNQVYFYVKGERVIMDEGSLWYIDVQERHAVKNEGSEARIHLVLDLMINPYIKNLFPPLTAGDHIQQAAYKVGDICFQGVHSIYTLSGVRRLRWGLHEQAKKRRMSVK